MGLLKNSVICTWLLNLWGTLTAAWPESALCHMMEGLGAWVAGLAKDSAVCGAVSRDGALSTVWTNSLLYRFIHWLINLPGALFRWLYRKGERAWEGSLVLRSLSKLGGVFYLAVGGFAAVMLVAPHDLWNNLYALVGAALIFVLFAAGSAGRPDCQVETWNVSPYFVFFLIMAMCSFFTSQSRTLSLRFVGFYLTLFLLVLLTISAVHTVDQLQTLVAVAMGGLTVAALYGCVQGVMGVEIVANQQDMTINIGMPGRIYSFFDNPNNFAEILVMLLPLDFALFLNARDKKWKLAALCSCGAGLIALGLTYSRSAFLGIALAALVFLAFENWKLIPLLMVAVLCAVPLLPKTIYNRILTIGNTKDSSLNYRFAIYEASGWLMKDYWLKGVGLGSDVMKETFLNYPPMFDGNYPLHTHNNYLQIWAEMGIFGILAYLAALLGQLKSGIRAFRTAADKRLRRLLEGALSGFCGILLISVAEYTWYYPRNMFFFWFLFAVIGAGVKLAKAQSQAA